MAVYDLKDLEKMGVKMKKKAPPKIYTLDEVEKMNLKPPDNRTFQQKVQEGVGNIVSPLVHPVQAAKAIGGQIQQSAEQLQKPAAEGGAGASPYFAYPYEAAKTLIADPIASAAQSVMHPQESFGKRPVETTLDWATFALPVFKGLRGVLKLGEKALLLDPDVQTSMVKAIKPYKKNFNFERDIKAVVPEVNKVAQEAKLPINGIADFNKALKMTKQKVWSQYEQLLGTAEDKSKLANVAIDGNKVAKAMVQTIDQRWAEQNPKALKEIMKKAETYRGKKLSPIEAENYIESVNNELDSFYSKDQIKQGVASRSPSTGYMVNEAKELRRQLDEKINTLAGEHTQPIKNLYGSLKNVENESRGREIVASRAVPYSLGEQMGTISGAGDIASAAYEGKFGKAVGGAVKIGVSKIMKERNTTDWLIKHAFERYNRPTAPKIGPLMFPKAQIGAGGLMQLLREGRTDTGEGDNQ